MSVTAPTFTRVHLRKRLSDSELSGELAVSARRERAALGALLGYLGQFDERKVYAAAGFTSRASHRGLHIAGFTSRASHRGLHIDHGVRGPPLRLVRGVVVELYPGERIQAARLCVRFPVLLGVIADGGLHLSGVCMLAPITNDETLPRILGDAAGLKRWELQMYVDALRREQTRCAGNRRPRRRCRPRRHHNSTSASSRRRTRRPVVTAPPQSPGRRPSRLTRVGVGRSCRPRDPPRPTHSA